MRPATASGLALAAVIGAGVLVPRPAAAAPGEKEWQLSLRAGAGTVGVDKRKPWGLAGALDAEYGVSDAWAVRLSVESSIHPVSADNAMDKRPSGNVLANAALAGVTYTVDVLRLVPYVTLAIGAIHFGGAVQTPRTLPAAELGAGADYFLDRRWIFGGSVQYLYAPSDLLGNPFDLGTSPFAFSITVRAARVF